MSSTNTTLSADVATQDISWIALTVVCSVLSLATLIVGLRIYTRKFLLKHLGWDDYIVVLALIIMVIDGSVVLSTIPFGLGRHVATIDPSLLVSYLRNFWLSIVLYNLTLAMVKLTFLFQYYRVLAVHQMKRVIWVGGTIIMLWAISQLLVVIFNCTPVQKFWETDLDGTCIPNLPFWYINAAGNIVTDLAIFIMPLPVLNRLQLRKKQKYFLLGIFSLGFFTCAISLIRLAYLKQGPDFTFDNVPTSCWSIGELGCAITCACLPTLRPLMTKLKPQWMISYAKKSRKQTYGDASGHARYGGGTIKGNHTDINKSRTRTTGDSSLTVTSANFNKNYSRLDDDDIERAMRMPAPLSPSYRKTDSSDSERYQFFGKANMETEAVQMQQLPPRNKSHRTSANEKALEVLGMGLSKVGVSTTKVVGGNKSTSSATRAETIGGIEVKRDVIITTTPRT
ncbi:hypothetical protein N0V93_002365 [Gnomoniopsis smithogilvyi]|uniref:Rhodopsin domain-containing protein n=1 Tax=Gnomoniopsis smithogilvyi TaxID=1191159 RepID=A0A9W8YWH8_9PEZI|nr:hypothetical protein N0V93_002365 [Gnomoniopsis smithogilvyi]